MIQKMRKWVNTWLGACVGVTAGLVFLAAVTVGPAAAEPQKGKAVEQSTQGQQLCPATPGAGPCKVVLDCPAGKTPGKDHVPAHHRLPGDQATRHHQAQAEIRVDRVQA